MDAHFHMEGIGQGIAKHLNTMVELTLDAKQYRTWPKGCEAKHDYSNGLKLLLLYSALQF